MEMLDIVNDNDEVIGQADVDEIYERLLTHRIVHVLVLNKKGEMALQLRGPTVTFCPNYWSTAVGGHVSAGESYEEAALREMEEEIGINAPLELLSKETYPDPTRNLKKILCTFKSMYDQPLSAHNDEVTRVEFFSLEKIQEMIDSGEKFHPELLFLLRKHFGLRT